MKRILTIEDFIQAELPVYGGSEPVSGTFKRAPELVEAAADEAVFHAIETLDSANLVDEDEPPAATTSGIAPKNDLETLADGVYQIYVDYEKKTA